MKIAPSVPRTSAKSAEQRHHDDRGGDARQDELLGGIGAERADGVDLLGHVHRADLGRHAAADAPADDDRRERRRELAQEREDDDARDVLDAAEALQAERELDGHDHPDEDATSTATMPIDCTPSDSIW